MTGGAEAVEGVDAAGRRALGEFEATLGGAVPIGAYPAQSEEVLTQFQIANMIYSHAQSIYALSYDKEGNTFLMTMDSALDVATRFFAKAFSHVMIVERFRRAGTKYNLPNAYEDIPLMTPPTEAASDKDYL